MRKDSLNCQVTHCKFNLGETCIVPKVEIGVRGSCISYRRKDDRG
jgi:hypothetical protein